MSLYYYKDENKKDNFFIQKREMKDKVILPFKRGYKKNLNGFIINSMTSNSTNHIDTLKKYMDDATGIYPDIELIDIPMKSNLLKLVIQYNSLFGDKYVSLKPKKTINPIGVFFTPGGIYSTTMITDMSKYTIFGGFSVSVHLLKNNDHYFVNSGAFIAGFTETSVLNDKVQVMSHDNLIRIPLKLEYRLTENTIQPRFNIGYNLYNSHLGAFILSSLSAGVNVKLTRYLVLSVLPEFEFKGAGNFSLIPDKYKSFNIFAGLEIKL
jgi:hypothetical protein